MENRYGARIVNLPPNVILVEQTIFSEREKRYVIDHDRDGKKIERHVKRADDKAIADAVRAACEGTL